MCFVPAASRTRRKVTAVTAEGRVINFTGVQIFICGNHSVSKALSSNILNCDFFHNAYQRNRLNVPLAV
jgi:hypothetical protein